MVIVKLKKVNVEQLYPHFTTFHLETCQLWSLLFMRRDLSVLPLMQAIGPSASIPMESIMSQTAVGYIHNCNG